MENFENNKSSERELIAARFYELPNTLSTEMLDELYLNDDAYKAVSTRVEKNEFIENGGQPTGIRDLEYSYEVVIEHESGARVVFSREDLEYPFTVGKDAEGKMAVESLAAKGYRMR